MRIFILRHGETEWNKLRRLQGSTNIPLDENGLRLASMVGDVMKEQNLAFDACVSSPLVRARRTAELVLKPEDDCEPKGAAEKSACSSAADDAMSQGVLADIEGKEEKSTGIPFTLDERIAEINMGPMEGQCVIDDDRFPKADPQVRNFFHKPEAYQPPEGAESFEDVIRRTGEFLKETAQKYKDYEGKDFKLLVSTHGCASRAMLMNIDPVPLENYWRDQVPPNCCVSIAELEDGVWKLVERDHVYAAPGRKGKSESYMD